MSNKDAADEKPWYREGLRFTCTQCGDCCTGSPGYVWVNQEEIARLAARLGLSVDDFEDHYVRRVGVRKSLTELTNGDCILFDGATRRCTVYEDRPRQCRSWPFWQSNVRSEEAWEETCRVCPGSGQGQLYTPEQIVEQLKMIRI